MRIQEEFFRQNIEQYLLPLVVDEDELNLLISEPCGLAWKDPALETRLRARLPKAYDLYLETIEELGEVMKSLQDELGVGKIEPSLVSDIEPSFVPYTKSSHRIYYLKARILRVVLARKQD